MVINDGRLRICVCQLSNISFQNAEIILGPIRFNIDNDGVMSRRRGQCHNDNRDVYIDGNIDNKYIHTDDHRRKCIVVVGDCDNARRWHPEKSVPRITITIAVAIAVFAVVFLRYCVGMSEYHKSRRGVFL